MALDPFSDHYFVLETLLSSVDKVVNTVNYDQIFKRNIDKF